MQRGDAVEKLKKQQGAIITLFALLLPVLLAFTGLAVDLGRLYMEQNRLQNIADAAVLAGLAELKAQNKANGQLVTDMPDGAVMVDEEELLEAANTGANEYLRKNSGDFFNLEDANEKKVLKTAIYRIKNNDDKYSYFYELIVGHEYPLYFGRIIYPNDMLVQAGAVVQFNKIESLPDGKTYQYYFDKWRDTPLEQLKTEDPEERIKLTPYLEEGYITITMNAAEAEVVFLNSKGEKVRTVPKYRNGAHINIAKMKKGSYTVKVKTGKGTRTAKFTLK